MEMEDLCFVSISLGLYHAPNAVDPWTTLIWTVQVHLYVDFFQSIQYYYNLWLVESKDARANSGTWAAA